MKERRIRIFIFVSLFLFLALPATEAEGQVLGVKTNALAWGAGGSFNVGVDWGFAKQWSLELDAIYNPFTHGDGKKTNVWGFQPEVRFWPRYKYAGHFLGLHGHYAQYDWGLWKYRYKGDLVGGGLSYGYAWMLGDRWNIEATAGFGYTRLDHMHKYDRKDSSVHYPAGVENKWGLSRIGISVTYFIK